MPSSEVFHKYGAGQLHSGSKKGPVVKNHAQAVAIFLSEKRKEGQHGGKYPHKQSGGPQGPTGMPPLPPAAHPSSMAPPYMGGVGALPGMGPPGLGGSPMGMQQPGPGMGRAYQFGGSPTSMGLTPGWIERQEARGMTHTGPIVSAVGGRTDHHAINVPSGSYVLPAAHVSAMGQGNTLNGMQILQGMFGAPMKLTHGSGPPRPPGMYRPPKLTSSGGGRGEQIGKPVPIMASGGEFVLSPDQVAKVGGGDINHGHSILDRWVQNTHKKYAKTIANLPPPAKT